MLFESAFLYSFKISFILLVSLFSQNVVFLFDHRGSLLLLIFQKRLLDSCIFFLFFCKLHDFLGSLKGGLFLLEYSLVKFILLDFLLDHIISLFASFLDSLNGFGLLFLQKCNSIVKFYNIILLFQTHSPRFLPSTEITWGEALCLASECVTLAILEIVGHLAFLKHMIFGEVWGRSLVFINVAIFHWVYLNIHINCLVISVFIGFYVIRATDHILTLVLLILSGALISLVHKLFLGSAWILAGGCI